MRLRTAVVVTVLLLSLIGPIVIAPVSAQSCSFPMTATDATGTEVTLQEEPQRVVSLGPSAAQTMWEIDARGKIIGLSRHASYLEGSESRTRISTSEQLVSIEAVVDLQPDIVLAPHVVSNETVEKLRETGLTVYYFSRAETIEDVSEKTQLIGRLTGGCLAADVTVSSMEDRISVVHNATEGRERPDVLYLFFGYTAGEGTFIDEIIETAGGNNIAADANITGYQQVNDELIVLEDPDWIVRNSDNPAGIDSDVLNRTTAVRENQTVVVRIEHLNQAAPRIVYAITALTNRFHPDAYEAANSTVTSTDPPTTTATSGSNTATQTPIAGTETSVTEVLGVGLAVAILAVAIVIWRREG